MAEEAPPGPVDADDPGQQIDGPSEADLAEMFGGGAPLREEESYIEDGGELPELDQARQKIPAKTQVLMEELFRAKLAKVRRVNPRQIR